MGTAPDDSKFLLTGEIIIEKPDFGRKGRIYYSKLLTKSEDKKLRYMA